MSSLSMISSLSSSLSLSYFYPTSDKTDPSPNFKDIHLRPIEIKKPRSIYDIQKKKLFKTPLEIDEYQELHPSVQNKKIIAISPGGYKGFYTMGVVAFIKEHYDLSDFIFTGASAGSWNSLFACLKPPLSIHLLLLLLSNPTSLDNIKLHYVSIDNLDSEYRQS